MGQFVRLMWISAVLSTVPMLANGMDNPSHQEADGHTMRSMSGDSHAEHKKMLNDTGFDRSEHRYNVPPVSLTDTRGEAVKLPEVLASEKPVILNFIYSTCSTICPVMSATFAEVQKRLGAEAKNVRMISITIDPEHDTPNRLAEYADKLDAGPGWRFFTGDYNDVVSVQKAFDIYRGSKTNHIPATFLRSAPDNPWARLEGLPTAGEVVSEYRRLTAK